MADRILTRPSVVASESVRNLNQPEASAVVHGGASGTADFT